MVPARVSVLIPAYNEAPSVAEIVLRIRSLHPHFEILVIDDGSHDGTGEAAQHAGAKIIRHPRNRGYGASLKTGMLKAQGQTLVFFDADGEHNPQDIGRLVQAMEQAEMAVGARKNHRRNFFNRLGKKILSLLAHRMTGRTIPDLNSGLRAVTRSAALKFLPRLPDGFSLTTTLTLLMLRNGHEVVYLPVKVSPAKSASRVSAADFFRTFFRILRMFFLPLKKGDQEGFCEKKGTLLLDKSP